jgi:uncharacterized protein YbbK (DUF523 family)
MIIVSACLAGLNCKYNGGNSLNTDIQKLVSEGVAIPVCPEQMGGCPTPRLPVEIDGGTGADVLERRCMVVRKNGEDVTAQLLKGGEEVLKVALLTGADRAILKARSPSCGCGEIYDGTFSGRLIPGNGVAAEMLIRNGIMVFSEENFKDALG